MGIVTLTFQFDMHIIRIMILKFEFNVHINVVFQGLESLRQNEEIATS